jgi:hypothetical protein
MVLNFYIFTCCPAAFAPLLRVSKAQQRKETKKKWLKSGKASKTQHKPWPESDLRSS